jgi:hypothetical protein
MVVLDTARRSNVLGDAEVDENVVLGRVGLRIETTDDSETTTFVKIISNGAKTSLETRERESLGSDVVGLRTFAC